MKIDSAVNAIYQHLPTKEVVAKSAATMFVTAVAVEALSSLGGAEAGPIAYNACIAACAGLFPPAVPICVQACLPLFFAPTP